VCSAAWRSATRRQRLPSTSFCFIFNFNCSCLIVYDPYRSTSYRSLSGYISLPLRYHITNVRINDAMSSPKTISSKAEQTWGVKMDTALMATRTNNQCASERRHYLWKAFVLASSIVWATIILRYGPLGSRRSESKTNEDQRQHHIWKEFYSYYAPAFRAIARLGMQVQDFVVLQTCRQKTLKKIMVWKLLEKPTSSHRNMHASESRN
jgi:hypothetical protein